jgi:excinuclease UvrABC nuclease subunit
MEEASLQDEYEQARDTRERIVGLEELLEAHVVDSSDKFARLERKVDHLLQCLQPLLCRRHDEGSTDDQERRGSSTACAP